MTISVPPIVYAVLCIVLLNCAVVSAQEPAPIPATTQFRGFRIKSMSTDILEEVRNKWGCNIVFYAPRPWHVAKQNNITVEQAWEKIIADWSEQLDQAKRLGLAVAIWVRENEMPNPVWKDYPDRVTQSGPWMHAFWNDESNLELLVKYWRKIAVVGKGRDQVIWYQPVSEPLDWEDFPHPPKNWHRWAQTLVNEIRSVDAEHGICIEPGPGGLCRGYEDWSALKGRNLIHIVHVYCPHEYTHQGIKNITGTDLRKPFLEINVKYPGEIGNEYWDGQRIEQWLQPAIDFQKRNGGRMLVGEFSVVRWAPGADQYLEDCIEIFEKHGWDWTYHIFRQANVWSVEHGPQYELDIPEAEGMTDRGSVLLRHLQRNSLGQAVEAAGKRSEK